MLIYGDFCLLARPIHRIVVILISRKTETGRGIFAAAGMMFDCGMTAYPVQSAAAFLASGEMSSRPFGRPGGIPCLPSEAELIERALM